MPEADVALESNVSEQLGSHQPGSLVDTSSALEDFAILEDQRESAAVEGTNNRNREGTSWSTVDASTGLKAHYTAPKGS
ncbi:hypothetical protein M0802_004742 [Mischocyttarus mexicanus]|nr:hypothetical protein M0802_004742 [Mischocyttarus mexicanus]